MKSLVIHGAGDLRIEDRSIEEPGHGQVRLRLERGGICGSDLHYFNHGGFGSVRLREPMILGHEVAGTIDAVGPDVTDLSIGQLVAVSPSRPCRSCAHCLRGTLNHCQNMAFYGSAMPFPHVQGAFRQVLVADATQCVVADGLTPAQAAMAEPLAVVLHAAKQAGDLLGQRVLITGCGPIGCLAIMVARRAGAAEIIATDLSAFTLAKAKEAGADITVNIADDPSGLTPYEAQKGQIDVHFECSGAAPALASGLAALRPRGVLVQLGLGGDMSVPMMALTAKEITLRGSFRFHPEFETGVTMMRSGLIDPSSLITQTMPMSSANDAFALANDRTRAMKVHLDFASA